MYQLVVDLKDFAAAHRLVKNYHGKCNHLHGHNYALRVRLATTQLDTNDLVIDFSELRKLCDEWVQGALDHATLVYAQDQELLAFVTTQRQKHYLLAHNTTVECLAKEIFTQLAPRIQAAATDAGAAFSLAEVELRESRHCGVIYSLQGAQGEGLSCGH